MVRFIIDLKLLYLIIIVNFFLFLKFKKITFNSTFIVIVLLFFIHGIIAYTLLGITYNYMLSQIIGIGIVGSYFYNFCKLYNIEKIIKAYLKMSLWIAIIGYPLWFFNINSNDGSRFQSIFTEPAHYAIVVIPACYYYFKSKDYFPFFVVFGTLLLSQSSIGYIGCGLMIIIPYLTLKRFYYLIGILPIVLLTFWMLYQNNENVKLRVNDTYESVKVLNTGKFKPDTNQSTYALISNLFVAKCNFKDHPLGSGIGSHFIMHTKNYLFKMHPPSYLVTLKSEKINAPDAASLFIRLFSELGVFGLMLVFGLMYKAFTVFKLKNLFLAHGIVIYLLLKLFRDGHYFSPEFFFFIWILFFSFKEAKKKLGTTSDLLLDK